MTITRHQAVGAYRRWQPVDFDAPDAPAGAEFPLAPAALEPAATPQAPEPEPDSLTDVPLPTAGDIERMHEEARAAGHAEGYAAGHAAGFEAGREAGHAEGAERVEETVRQLMDLAAGLDKALSQLDQEVAEELMALSIEIARQMVQHTLAVHPETVLQTVRNALLQMPQGHAQIRLHPEDLALVRENMGEQLGHAGHRLIEDAELSRGSCRIDSLGAQVDATLERRWRRILESLGHERAAWQPAEDGGEG